MDSFVLLFGGAGILTFLGTIVTLLANRNKSKAETASLIAEAEKTRLEAQGELQDQIFALVDHNKKIYEEREKERDAKRQELDLLGRRIETLSEMLSNEQSRAIRLLSENAEKDKVIRKLEENFKVIQEDVTKIKKVTGQLKLNGS